MKAVAKFLLYNVFMKILQYCVKFRGFSAHFDRNEFLKCHYGNEAHFDTDNELSRGFSR